MKEINLIKDEKVVLLEISGEIDVVNAFNFYDEVKNLYEQNKKNIVLDFLGVTFIDSTALGVIVKLENLIQKDGHTIIIKKANEQIKKVLVICSLDKIIKIEG